MTTFIFLIVLIAALLHALWNTLVKRIPDKKGAMTSVVLGHIPFALVCMFISPIPVPESWIYIVIGACIHFAYQIFLLNAYKFGDLTQVYPVARGIAPLLVTLFSILFLNTAFSPTESIAIVSIAAGMMSMAIHRSPTGQRNPKAFWLAIGTGCMIASYSVVDGIGAKLAGSALGFYGWLSILNGVFMTLYLILSNKGSEKSYFSGLSVYVAVVGGGISFIAYGLVIWAFTQSSIALVTALRETSIVFVFLIGVFILKEKMSINKIIATLLTVFGAVLLRVSH